MEKKCCILCKSELRGLQQKYCSKYCSNKYLFDKWRKHNRERYNKIMLKHATNYQTKNKERVKKYHKEYYQKNKEKWKKYWKNDRIKHKEPKKIRNKTRRYVEFPKDQKCQACDAKKATERHHNNYGTPLNIIFLCQDCHKNIHRKNKRFYADNIKKEIFIN